MNQRRFIAGSLLGGAALTLPHAAGALAADVSVPDKPNIVVINIDDMGYGDITPFGSTINRTPNLDRMAQEGRRLTSFYAAPVCTPSRTALMTGCYPKRALPIEHVLFPENDIGLAPQEITIAELLQQQGYATACIGKWHLGDQPQFLPRRQGFEFYFGLPYSNDMGPTWDGASSSLDQPLRSPKPKEYPPLALIRNDTVMQVVRGEDQSRLTARYTDVAEQYIRDHQDGPFFLYLAHAAVHFPIYPSRAFVGRNEHGIYSDWVEEVDWSVGRVLDAIRESGLESRTLVIFTSDNGGTKARASNAPLRGYKNSTWEGGIRVPTIAWWPGHIPAGTDSDVICGMMDILPTVVNLAGGELPTDRKIDGADLMPILAGDSDAKLPHEQFFYFHGLNLEAVRRGPWKLHLKKGELYNLHDDIGETTNVAAEHGDIVQQLTQLADDMDKDLGVAEIGPGCRTLGHVDNPRPIISRDGVFRTDLAEQTSN